jgi:hypothetical protein
MVFAAWTTGGAWAVSAPLTGTVTSISAGADGTPAVTLAGGRAAVLAGTVWRELPALPAAPHVTLALLAGGTIQALATRLAVLTVWQLSAAGGWEQVQRTTVPLQFGSST